jgi:hypothetical protein
MMQRDQADSGDTLEQPLLTIADFSSNGPTTREDWEDDDCGRSLPDHGCKSWLTRIFSQGTTAHTVFLVFIVVSDLSWLALSTCNWLTKPAAESKWVEIYWAWWLVWNSAYVATFTLGWLVAVRLASHASTMWLSYRPSPTWLIGEDD